jgi:hypothetical protein
VQHNLNSAAIKSPVGKSLVDNSLGEKDKLINVMTETVNLNKFRKAKKHADKQQQAAQNRVSHGRTKAEKALDQAKNEGEASKLDGQKLDRPGPNSSE